MRRLDVGEREDGLTACPVRGGAQQRHPVRVRAFQPPPVQPAGRVLMVEEVDEPVRRIGRGSAVIARYRRAEVLAEQVGQFGGCPVIALRAACVPVQEQVVGQRDPVTRRHPEHLVPTISVEGDERQRRLRSPVGLPLLVVTHHQLAAGVAGRQGHHQGPDHRVVLLRILMDEEELVRLIDQEGVKIGGQPGGVRQPQLFFHRGENVPQRGVIPSGADQVLGDLPRIADIRIGQRLLATAEPGRLTEADKLAGLRRSHREPDLPEALNLQAQVGHLRRQLNAERGPRIGPQRPGQPVTRRRHHRTDPPASRETVSVPLTRP